MTLLLHSNPSTVSFTTAGPLLKPTAANSNESERRRRPARDGRGQQVLENNLLKLILGDFPARELEVLGNSLLELIWETFLPGSWKCSKTVSWSSFWDTFLEAQLSQGRRAAGLRGCARRREGGQGRGCFFEV